jgi:hypothetical protein
MKLFVIRLQMVLLYLESIIFHSSVIVVLQSNTTQVILCVCVHQVSMDLNVNIIAIELRLQHILI